MKIKIERSGGLAGISVSNELEIQKLPPQLEATARDLLQRKKLPKIKSVKSTGSADQFNYKITIQNGNKDNTIECDEMEMKMDPNLKYLVNFVQNKQK